MSDFLYQLLPAVYRIRDAAYGQPLLRLLQPIEAQYQLLQADMDGLYANWFIETCSDWAVSYIADLLRVRGLPQRAVPGYSLRAYVANTLRYRAGKGTLEVFDTLTRDLTGWPARVVEFPFLIGRTQNMLYPQLSSVRTAALGQRDVVERLEGPFDNVPHSVDLRKKYNLNRLGLFAWRLRSFPQSQVVAAPVSSSPGCYTFNPVGIPQPLFNRYDYSSAVPTDTREVVLPCPLRCPPLHAELEALRAAVAAGQPVPAGTYFGNQPVFTIQTVAQSGQPPLPVPQAQIYIADLGNLAQPRLLRSKYPPNPKQQSWLVDPLRGYLAMWPAPSSTSTSAAPPPSQVLVSYFYGATGELGGGGYGRPAIVDSSGVPLPASASPSGGGNALSSIGSGSNPYHVQIQDSLNYALPALNVAAGQALVISALSGEQPMLIGPFNAARLPCSLADGASLTLEGLLVTGGLTISVPPHAQVNITLRDCTFAPIPGIPSLSIQIGSGSSPAGIVSLTLARCITGTVVVGAIQSCKLTISDSIIDGSLEAVTANVTLSGVTIGGDTQVGTMAQATDVIFCNPARAQNSQQGCVRYCYVPPSSQLPPGYRCQPATAIQDNPSTNLQLARDMTPQFVSTTYGQPGYYQLSPRCSPFVSAGGSNDGEMGALHFLNGPPRQATLNGSIPDYLRLGTELDIFFAT